MTSEVNRDQMYAALTRVSGFKEGALDSLFIPSACKKSILINKMNTNKFTDLYNSFSRHRINKLYLELKLC